MSGVQIAFDTSRVFTYTDKYLRGVQTGNLRLGVRYEDEAGKIYQFCINGHSAAQTAGNVSARDYNGAGLTLAVGPLTAVAGNSFVLFKASTATLNLMAGVWMGDAPLSSSAQTGAGWVQVQGQNDSILFEGTTAISIGDSLKMVNAQFYVVKDAATGTTPAFQSHIIALVAYSTASTALKSGYISCNRYA